MSVSPEFEAVERLPAFRSLKTRIADQLRILASAADSFDRERAAAIRHAASDLDASAFNVAVIGEFNRGKTTLVNALLDRADLLRVAPLPNTAAITRIAAVETGNGEFFRVIFRDSAHPPLISADLSTLDQYVSDATTSATNGAFANSVERIELFLDSEFLRRNGIVLIDTPGLGAISRAHQDVTERIIPTVHAALFVFMLDPPLGAAEIAFLQFSMAYIQRFLFVMNDKQDALSSNPTDAADVMAYAHQQLSHAGIEAPLVVGLNPRAFLRGKGGGFNAFLPILADFLIAGRGRALLDDAIHKANRHFMGLHDSLDRRLLDLERQTGELRAEQRQLQARAAELQTRQQSLQAQVDAELNEFVTLITADVDALAAHIDRDVAAAIDEAGIGALRTIQVHLPQTIQKTVNHWMRDKSAWINGRSERLYRRITDSLREWAADYQADGLVAAAPGQIDLPIGLEGVNLSGDVALALATGLGIASGVALLDVLTSGGVGGLSLIVGGAAGSGTAGAMLLQRIRTSLKQTLHKPLPAPNESQTPLSALVEGYVNAEGQSVPGLRAQIAAYFQAASASVNIHIASVIQDAWQPRFAELEAELAARNATDSDLVARTASLVAAQNGLDAIGEAFKALASEVQTL